MKTLNKFRATDQFCITGTAVDHLAAIRQFCVEKQLSLVCVGFENDEARPNEYNVRVIKRDVFGTEVKGMKPRGLYDVRVEVCGLGVRLLEQATIQEVAA
jgi:hypothetical protein